MPGNLLLLAFHHVRERNDPTAPGLHHRTPQQVAEQIQLLGRSYDFPPLAALDAALTAGTALPSDACALTFDDGLRDHHDVVLPLLDRLGLQAVFAVSTGFWEDGRLLSVHMAHLLSASFSYAALADDLERAAVDAGETSRLVDVDRIDAGRQYPYDSPDDAVVKHYLNAVIDQGRRKSVLRRVFEQRLGDEHERAAAHYLSPEMARTISRTGHRLALHSHRHLNLAASPRELRTRDLAMNREFLREVASEDDPVTWVSYPYGAPTSWDASVVDDLRSLGCTVGLTMTRGVNATPVVDAMRLSRLDTNDAIGGKSPLAPEQYADP